MEIREILKALWCDPRAPLHRALSADMLFWLDGLHMERKKAADDEQKDFVTATGFLEARPECTSRRRWVQRHHAAR